MFDIPHPPTTQATIFHGVITVKTKVCAAHQNVSRRTPLWYLVCAWRHFGVLHMHTFVFTVYRDVLLKQDKVVEAHAS